jgi:hypothetical protein
MGSKGAVQGGVLSVTGATAVEALEADIEAVDVVLSGISLVKVGSQDKLSNTEREVLLTIESKHWVQSSR